MKYVQYSGTEPGTWERAVIKDNIGTALKEAATLVRKTQNTG